MRHSLGAMIGELLNSMVSIVDFLESLLDERARRGKDGLILPLSTSSMLYIIVSFIERKGKRKRAVKE
jgi:hypothetical protein